MQVTLYSKPDCSLCAAIRYELEDLQEALGFDLVERNILEDAGLYERYRYLIPVIDIQGGTLYYAPIDRRVLRTELATRAKQRGSNVRP